MYNKTFKLLVFNIFLFSVVAAGFYYDYVSFIFRDDITHISYFIGLLLFFNIILKIYDTYQIEKLQYMPKHRSNLTKYVNYVLGQFFYIGLVGTLIGFLHMIKGIQNMNDIQLVLKVMVEGCQTLFGTTLLGLVAYLWTRFNNYLDVGE